MQRRDFVKSLVKLVVVFVGTFLPWRKDANAVDLTDWRNHTETEGDRTARRFMNTPKTFTVDPRAFGYPSTGRSYM